MYNHNKAQQSKNRVDIPCDILYVSWNIYQNYFGLCVYPFMSTLHRLTNWSLHNPAAVYCICVLSVHIIDEYYHVVRMSIWGGDAI